MSEDLYTVERAAERLGVHAKTVLRFIHDGRLRATRIGKAYRILRSDLDAFAGVAPGASATAARATAIVDIADTSMELSRRLATALQAMVMSNEARPQPIQLDTVYDPERRHLKVVIIAAPADAAALLRHLDGLLEAFR